jgi:UDP-glucose:(heptosyl)LPS alpha-1,3-glucosyltransferase
MTSPPSKSAVPAIAIVRQRYTPFGGGEEIIRQAAELLSSDGGVELSVVAREWSGEQSGNVRFVRCDPPFWGRIMRDVGFCRRASALTKGQYDIVQSHERVRDSDIYRAGDGAYRCWLDNYIRASPWWRRLLLRLSLFHRVTLAMEKRMYASRSLKAVIANSQMVAEDIGRHFPSVRDRIHVIWNGVDCTRFFPGLRARHRHAVLQRHGLSESHRVVVFLGSGWIRKGLITAIHAIAEMPVDVRLMVVGHEKNRRKYEQAAGRLGVLGRVVFAGPRHDPEAYLGCADALVLPSVYDAMPNSVLEAMAAAVPVVVSTHTGAAHLVTASQGGVVCDPFVCGQWAPALHRVLEVGARQQMGAAGRSVAMAHSMERMASEWMSLYRTLLGLRA